MFEPGQRVVIRGKCLGMVVSVGDFILVEELDLEVGEESRFEIPTDRAAEALRPIVPRVDAERILATARQRLPRPVDDRSLAYRRALKSGDLDEQARLLAASYAGPQEAPETQYQERLENSVFGELALVLGRSRKALRAQVREAAMAEAPSRALALPDVSADVARAVLPALQGLEPIGAFAVHDKLAVGENRAEVIVDAVPGIWFAYASTDDDEVDELVAIHAERVAEMSELERVVRMIGKSPIEGAHIAIFDEALADDADLFDQVSQAAIGVIDDRCAAVGLPGDGYATVRVSPAGRAAYVRVELSGGW